VSELPRVVIVLVTCARTEYAVRTVRSVRENLVYSQELGWYVADDGSPGSHFEDVVQALGDAPIIGCHSEDFVPGKKWPGKSWNKAWEFAHEWTPIVLWMEDDFILVRQLDITPYVKLLMGREDVGMIRLGLLPVGLDCHTVGHDGIHYLEIKSSTPYQFSGNPSLRHRRFAQFYGPYPENVNPGDTEVDYDNKIRSVRGGPKIYWPVDLGGWGIFNHVGEEQSYQ